MERLRLVYDAEKDSSAARRDAGVHDAILAAEQDLVVMFTDLVGFSRIAAMTGSRAAGALLSRVLGEQIQIVEASGGVVRNIMGDGIMASWTIGRRSERRAIAARAVRVALAIAEAMERHPSPLPDQQGVSVRIGLHVGPALFGTIAAGHAAGETLIGDTVNIAAKLEQARRARAESFGAVRISDELYQELCPVQQALFPQHAAIRTAGRLLRMHSGFRSGPETVPESRVAEPGELPLGHAMTWNRCLDRLADHVATA
jgi:class 3 adenylate cyclase